MTRRRSTHNVNTARKLIWWRPNVVCSSCNQKGYMKKVCKRKQQEVQIAQENMTRRRSFFLWRLALLVTSLMKHG